MKYTVQYFIDKFSAIPDKYWTTGIAVQGDGKKCALGHCGVVEDTTEKRNWIKTDEANALERLFNPGFNPSKDSYDLTWRINDRFRMNTDGDTPKERILNALRALE